MRFAAIAAFAIIASLAGPAPAQAQSKEQIKAQCKAMHGGAAGVRNADRTGVTVAQAVAKCVKQRSAGKKG